MSHGNEHHIEENPKSSTTSAFYFVLLIGALALGIITFQRSMSHAEESHHGDAKHEVGHEAKHEENKGGHWTESTSLEYSSNALVGKKAEEQKPKETVVVVSTDSTQTADSSKTKVETEKKEADKKAADTKPKGNSK